jgi:hypothetical protein
MGSDVGRIVRAAGAAKDHERINFFFVVRTHQDGTTIAAYKFDGIGQLQRWRCPGHHFDERRWDDLKGLR